MEENFNKHLGNKLKLRRLALGLTQTKVAKAINVTFQQIQKYEKGTNGVSSIRLLQLANYLKVPINYFFEDFSEYLINLEKSQEGQVNNVATRKLENNPDNIDIDPDVNPMFVREAKRAQQSLPPGNVARNMGDNAALAAGDTVGTPAPIISESMRNKVLRSGDTSRGAVLGVAEAARDAGDFNTVINGVKYSRKKMSEAYILIIKVLIN